MEDFEREMKAGFLEEVSQMLVDVEQCFLELEINPNDVATLEKIFRIAHNVKGSAKAVGFDDLGSFTHEFESFLLKCKSGQIPIHPPTVSLLLRCNDHIEEWIEVLKGDLSANLDNQALINEIQTFKIAENSEAVSTAINLPSEHIAEEEKKSDGTIYLDEVAVLTEGSEAFTLPNLATSLSSGSPSTASSMPKVQSDESIRVSLFRLEDLLNFVGEMVILQTVLREQAYASNPQILRRTIHQMGKVTKEVQDISMGLRMVPLKQTFQKMQRIVRDTSSHLEKKVQLTLEGEQTEVDKTILEALSDPLVHLIRNAVDHGIETPSERMAKGKSEVGQVLLRAYHQGGKLIIEVKDNGGGISVARLKQKAVEKGILKPDQHISDQDAVNLIFHSGFSTKSQVTEVSGRGVGMDVVKTNIEQIHGEILVETVLNEGSTFKICLPLTLAIIDGMVIRCGAERYIVPLSHVHETVKPKTDDIKFVTGMGETLLLRGEDLPVIRLSHALGKNSNLKSTTEQIAIIVRSQGQPFATLVDDVIGQHQVVIKKLGAEMQNLHGYSGCAILGDGKAALILELAMLIASKTSSSNIVMKGQVAI